VDFKPEDLAKCSFKYFFVRVLKGKWAPHHDEWYDLLQNKRRILIECARGHGKTYFIVAYSIWLVYRGNPVDILLISYSEEQVKNNIMNLIDKIIMNNDMLAMLRPTSKQQWGAQLKTFSNGSQIRGESFGSSVRGAHPDFLFVDDPLKDKGGMTPLEQIEYYMTALMGTVKEHTLVAVTGTPLDNGDLLEQLESNPAYTFKSYPAENEERTQALFPHLYSLEFLKATEKERGTFAYSREYLLKRIDPHTAVFKDMYRTINSDYQFPEKYSCVRTIIDPAASEKEDACDSAVVTVGVDYENHKWEIDTRLIHSDDPSEVIKEVLRQVRLYKGTSFDYAVVCENEVFQKWVANDLRQVMLKEGLDFLVIPVEHTGNQGKHQRIQGLQPAWEARGIHLLPESPLISQFRYYRPHVKGVKLDGIDALSWIRDEKVALPIVEAEPYDPGVPEDAWQ
jgi:hypothetical protein